MTPTILFRYLRVSDLMEVCSVCSNLQTDKEKLSSVLGNMVSCTINKIDNIENAEMVCLPRILEDDIQLLTDDDNASFNRNDFNELLMNLTEKYGYDFMDLIITDDNESIIKSITDVINFLMKDVFKSNRVRIAFTTIANDMGVESNYPTLIYSSLQQNFIIKEHSFMLNLKIITIEKRSEDNVNNAN